MKGTHFHKSIN